MGSYSKWYRVLENICPFRRVVFEGLTLSQRFLSFVAKILRVGDHDFDMVVSRMMCRIVKRCSSVLNFLDRQHVSYSVWCYARRAFAREKDVSSMLLKRWKCSDESLDFNQLNPIESPSSAENDVEFEEINSTEVLEGKPEALEIKISGVEKTMGNERNKVDKTLVTGGIKEVGENRVSSEDGSFQDDWHFEFDEKMKAVNNKVLKEESKKTVKKKLAHEKKEIEQTVDLYKLKIKSRKPKPEKVTLRDSLYSPIGEKLADLVEAHDMRWELGHTCVHTSCVSLSSRLKTKRQHQMFIDFVTGSYVCYHCKRFGDFENLAQITKIMKSTPSGYDCLPGNSQPCVQSDASWEGLVKYARPVGDLSLNSFQKMTELFNCEVINQSTFVKYMVLFDENEKSLFFPYVTRKGVLVGYSKKTVTGMRECFETNEREPIIDTTSYMNNCLPQMFGWRGKRSGKQAPRKVILTKMELDAMAINQETDYMALSPPPTGSFSHLLLPDLEDISHFLLLVEDDDFDVSLMETLGKERCSMLRPEVNSLLLQPLKALKEGESLLNGIRRPFKVHCEEIEDFSQLRKSVFAELENHNQVCGTKWKRFPALNDLLKGFRPGEMTVLTGGTGTGKTTFLCEYSLDLCQQGVSTLWGSFEISNTRLVKTMLSQIALEKLEECSLSNRNLAYSQLTALPMKFLTFHSQQNFVKVLEALEHGVYVHKVQHIIIDNIQFMMGIDTSMAGIDRFMKQDLIISAFRRFATEKKCHVTLVMHPRKEKEGEPLDASSIFGGAKASQEADNVLILQARKLSATRSKKYIQIVKNRFSGDLGVMALNFNKDSLTFSGITKKIVEDIETKQSDQKMEKENLISPTVSMDTEYENDDLTETEENDDSLGRLEIKEDGNEDQNCLVSFETGKAEKKNNVSDVDGDNSLTLSEANTVGTNKAEKSDESKDLEDGNQASEKDVGKEEKTTATVKYEINHHFRALLTILDKYRSLKGP